jgi:pSer/pThr/pTyr-binding forkhead associated (FHA) protein
MAKFIVLYNGEPLKTFELDEPVITIGRLPENTISIANMGVSRRHARIEEDTDRKLIITDLNSLNGTFINGKKAKKSPLNHGDKIAIGKYTIIYKTEGDTKGAEGEAQGKKTATTGSRRSATEQPEKDDEEPSPRSVTKKNAPVEESDEQQSQTAVLIETSKHVVYKLDKPLVTLGSGESDDIYVSGFMVGKGQVAIEQHEDGMYISAHKLMGKIKVNGRPTKKHLLKHKDRIEIGANTFRFMENG